MAQSIIGVGVLTSDIQAYSDVPDELITTVTDNESYDDDEPHGRHNITFTIETIIISAFIFIGILTWFEFLRTLYDNVFSATGEHNYRLIYNRLWYAIFITALVLILIYIVYRISDRY